MATPRRLDDHLLFWLCIAATTSMLSHAQTSQNQTTTTARTTPLATRRAEETNAAGDADTPRAGEGGTGFAGGLWDDIHPPSFPQASPTELSCSQRNKCKKRRGLELGYFDKNCYCDEQCQLYNDCCKDFRPAPREQGRTKKVKVGKRTLSCTRMAEIDVESEIYLVNKCPRGFSDMFVREMCEIEAGQEFDQFLKLPVSGVTSGLLYKNYYCALCAGETNVTLWQIRLSCNNNSLAAISSNTDMGLESILTTNMDACTTDYVNRGIKARTCKSHVFKCDKRWGDDRIERKCKSHTAYVYPLGLGSDYRVVFRNKFCALCNYVNDTYLSCEDPMRPPGDKSILPGIIPPPFSLVFDLNTGSGNMKVGVAIDGRETVTRVETRTCARHEVYDPFTKICRRVGCKPKLHFVGGECVKQSDPVIERKSNSVKPTPEDTTSDELVKEDRGIIIENIDVDSTRDHSRTPAPEDENDAYFPGPDIIFDCPYIMYNRSYFNLLENNSVYITPLMAVYDPGDFTFRGSSVLICTPFTSAVYNVTYNATSILLMFKFSRIQSLVSFVGLLMSLVALLICFVVYMLLPPLRNIPGKCVISLVVALFLAQGLFLGGTPRTEIPLACFILGVLMHYFFLVAFFWMNVLGIDICRTFISTRPPPASGSRSKRFVFYSLYAWLMPALIVSGSVAMDKLYLLDAFEELDPYKPQYGDGLCWITQRYALLFLFALPVGILLAFNFMLFILTLKGICSASEGGRTAVQRRKDTNRFLLYIKLSIIMGLTWIIGFAAAMTEIEVLWYVFIVVNTLQGVFICLAFVCTSKVFRLLRDMGRVHKTSNGSDARSYNNHNSTNGRWGYTRPSYLFDGEAKIISQETSI